MSHPGSRRAATKRYFSVPSLHPAFAEGNEALFLSPKANFSVGTSIRGGVPIVFPQFGGLGQLPAHGFARTQIWELVESAPDHATLHLHDNENLTNIWSHKFELEYTVRIGGNQLELSLKVTNTDSAPFEFTSALHTYLRVRLAIVTLAVDLLPWNCGNPSRMPSLHHGYPF